MEYAYSILMGIFALAILAYAGLMALTKDYNILPVRAQQSVKPKDPKRYMTQLAKVVALVSLSPALSALTGLWNTVAALVVLIGSMILFIWLGTRIMRGVE
ncbi:MAG: hypothetical protein IKI03_01265 [Clostridia bacterium]|nr:hypothetical protein [Clostridia bacterium]